MKREPPAFAGLAGAARRDITPPVGVHATSGWGASKHARSEGTHRPLLVTALALAERVGQAPSVVVAIDHVEFSDLISGRGGLVEVALEALGLERSRLMIACSHTHAGPSMSERRISRPGGELLEEYAETMKRGVIDAAADAIASLRPATITWGSGHCDLATNRDLPDLDPTSGRYLVGFNPDQPADDTVVVGRVTEDESSRPIATIVNYACHPTTLGWDNKLVSSDYVGAMRELVELHTEQAPSVFLQGASGDLAPAWQYTADPDLADRYGRQLAYSVLSVLEGMLPPARRLAYKETVESGAALAVWGPEPFTPDPTLKTAAIALDFPLARLPGPGDPTTVTHGEAWLEERVLRKQEIVATVGSGETHRTSAWIWRVGRAIVVGHPNEAYSDLQVRLRDYFPDFCIVVANVVNDSGVVAYLPSPSLYDKDVYSVWQSPYDKTCLGLLIDSCAEQIEKLMVREGGAA